MGWLDSAGDALRAPFEFAADPIGTAGEVIGEITGAADVQEAAEAQAAATLQSQREARELNIERFGEARELLSPYIEGAGTAREQMMVELGLAPGEAGTAYMETPGYESLLGERQRGAEQAAAGSGSLYSGRRIQSAADVGGATQSQFYTNYMNLLQNMASPTTATNLASMGVNQGTVMGQQQIGAQQVASGYMMGGAQAQQAAIGDIIGGGAAVMGGAYAGGYI
jgi:hypothetical protein